MLKLVSGKVRKNLEFCFLFSKNIYSIFSHYFGFMTFLKEYIEADEQQSSMVIYRYGMRIMILLIMILIFKYLLPYMVNIIFI